MGINPQDVYGDDMTPDTYDRERAEREGLWWDSDAPYGIHKYTFGRGKWVPAWEVSRNVIFYMTRWDVLMARGVAEMRDGRVYRYAIRRPGRWEENTPLRLASLCYGDFVTEARGMFERESYAGTLDPDSAQDARAQVQAL